jgi:hypothetical protein
MDLDKRLRWAKPEEEARNPLEEIDAFLDAVSELFGVPGLDRVLIDCSDGTRVCVDFRRRRPRPRGGPPPAA